ncbi:DUF4397 domain-containing protein [Nocardioides mangrovicus]|uniref:DUF4397 domain-containing protein n=1 Tax=Nocardioides mangrovicus TaxID=2478913 RepID=A0A3L8P142_9ACTN|nr:DUF4397 domain-containing protein [Nocardioides mangrovicus]RLV49095.1 DUF4397 domain-containing protein [Nocardioides mangrovicus]
MHTHPHLHWRRHRSALVAGLSTLLAAALLAFGQVPATAATDAAGRAGWIRAGHLASGVGEADIEISPFRGGRTRTLQHVSYGTLSAYERVPAGLYTVAVVPAGKSMSQAMVRQSVRVKDGTASTVFATGTASDVNARVVTDDLTPPASGQARIRLVSGAGDVRSVDASVVGGPQLAQNATAGSVSGYAEVPAQSWTIRVSAASGSGVPASTRRVTVAAGGVYTLLVLDGTDGSGLRVVPAVDSAGTATMPTGGVDTGGGYLSRSAEVALRGASTVGTAVGRTVGTA